MAVARRRETAGRRPIPVRSADLVETEDAGAAFGGHAERLARRTQCRIRASPVARLSVAARRVASNMFWPSEVLLRRCRCRASRPRSISSRTARCLIQGADCSSDCGDAAPCPASSAVSVSRQPDSMRAAEARRQDVRAIQMCGQRRADISACRHNLLNPGFGEMGLERQAMSFGQCGAGSRNGSAAMQRDRRAEARADAVHRDGPVLSGGRRLPWSPASRGAR